MLLWKEQRKRKEFSYEYAEKGFKTKAIEEINEYKQGVVYSADGSEVVEAIKSLAVVNVKLSGNEAEVKAVVAKAKLKIDDVPTKSEEDLANKPEQIRAKIVEGRVNKLMAQRCLIEQPFVKDPSQTIEQLISGKMEIKAFTRYMLGEGLEKKQENFAEEVMGQIKG